MPRLLPLALLLLSLSACGFQLRGAQPLPATMEQTYIQGADQGPFYFELENAIQAAGGVTVNQRDKASATLILHSQGFTRRESSVDPRGRINEYEHRLQVVFSLQDKGGRSLAERETVTVMRAQRFNPDQVLSMGEEQAMLHEEMRRQAVSQLLRRLHALAGQ